MYHLCSSTVVVSCLYKWQSRAQCVFISSCIVICHCCNSEAKEKHSHHKHTCCNNKCQLITCIKLFYYQHNSCACACVFTAEDLKCFTSCPNHKIYTEEFSHAESDWDDMIRNTSYMLTRHSHDTLFSHTELSCCMLSELKIQTDFFYYMCCSAFWLNLVTVFLWSSQMNEINRPCSPQTFWPVGVGQSQVELITLTMAQLQKLSQCTAAINNSSTCY